MATNNLERYDAIIIGAGQAGHPLALDLAKAGWKTAIVERAHVGGTCINVGCTPTKTMVASARVAYLARRAADYGVHVGTVSVDMAKVRQRKQALVESFRDGGQSRLEHTEGVTLIFGEAAFIQPKVVEVRLRNNATRQLAAEKIFINTGGRPEKPPLLGLEQVPYLDSTSIMELEIVPEHLLILGGGYIGLEFGQMFRRFGSRVTIVQRGKQLLAREDADVAAEVAKIFREDGVDVLLQTAAQRVELRSDGQIRLIVESAAGERALSGSHLLVAAGRVPNTDRLNLAAAGVQTDKRGFIQVNARLETNVPGIYALGDVKGGPAFTHISYDDYRLIRANLLEAGNAVIDGRFVPNTVFIDPQLGRVGLTEAEAKEKGYRIRVAKMPMAHVARALEMEESRGFMKAVIDADTNQILGGTILGIEGGELMALVKGLLPDGWQFSRKGTWYVCNPPDDRFNHLPMQGWKIHVSSSINNAGDILRAIVPILARDNINFKFALDLRILALMNSKGWARQGAGKFITIYPLDEMQFKSLIEELYQATRDFQGLYILSDRRYKDSRVIFYRSGGIRPFGV
ncbi:MAG: mercuric reductase, partial [candidate division KSB1 bacterium]|nr:mercuric reductase [candidate division KSB1 bacterium]